MLFNSAYARKKNKKKNALIKSDENRVCKKTFIIMIPTRVGFFSIIIRGRLFALLERQKIKNSYNEEDNVNHI